MVISITGLRAWMSLSFYLVCGLTQSRDYISCAPSTFKNYTVWWRYGDKRESLGTRPLGTSWEGSQ